MINVIGTSFCDKKFHKKGNFLSEVAFFILDELKIS